MGSIYFYSAHESKTTDDSGVVSIKTKIPGIFTGVNGFVSPFPQGRYFKKAQIWTENGSQGDSITNLRIEDTDGVLGAASAAFTHYPVIQTLYDSDVASNGGATSGGLGIPAGEIMEISAIDPIDNRGLVFVPAQMYLCSDFIAGDGASGRTIRVNYIWGKYFEAPVAASGG